MATLDGHAVLQVHIAADDQEAEAFVEENKRLRKVIMPPGCKRCYCFALVICWSLLSCSFVVKNWACQCLNCWTHA